MWSVERATSWWDQQAWPVGCNFIPSTAVNQLEMWQEATFDRATIERELGWAAGLGFNVLRVYLHDLLWEQDRQGFLDRIDSFLDLARQHQIRVVFVLFDDVWNTHPQLGPQPEPHPGRHNPSWVQSPGLPALNAYATDPAVAERLERYVSGVVSRFKDDDRILLWDVYNEPGGFPSPRSEPVGEACLPLLRDVFDWARHSDPSQPLTSGLWHNPVQHVSPAIRELQLGQSDVVSFHHYGSADELRELIDQLRIETDRPLLCTEYLARSLGNRFETQLPIFREEKIGAINWGLVSGRTQTIYPWWSWFDEEPKPEPEVWFHDILRSDGTAFDEAEAEFLRQITRDNMS
jgi:hypothetical protein